VSRVYPDSSVINYYLEREPAFRARTSAAFHRADRMGSRIVVSDLTYLECRVLPLRLNDTGRLGLFDAFFRQSVVEWHMLVTGIMACATELRAYQGLRVPDAIHLATALERQCDEFWTGGICYDRLHEPGSPGPRHGAGQRFVIPQEP